MPADAPVYQSKASASGLGQVQPLDIVGGERTAAALGGLGRTVAQVGAEFAQLERETDLTRRKTSFMQGMDALHQEADKNPDYVNAPRQFEEKVRGLVDRTFQGVSPSDRAHLDFWAESRKLAGLGEVRRQALGKQQSQFGVDVQTQSAEYLKRFDASATDVERAAQKQDFFTFLDDGVKRGMIGAQQAQAYKSSFTATGVGVMAQRAIATDPATAMAAFADPRQYADLDVNTRQQLLTQARQANDERQTLRLQNQALHNPMGALGTVGRARPEDARQIFEAATAKVEGGTTMVEGDRIGLVSPKGALGAGQIMPGTAREMARDMGRTDLLALSDQDLRARLLSDHELNATLSSGYLQKNLRRYEGSIPAAFAAYHAGPGAVDAAYARAKQKFGDNFSAEQFVGELSSKLHDGNMSTADYVRASMKRLGANPNGPGLSVNASYRAAAIVDARIAAERADQARLLQGMVSAQAGEVDQTIRNLWDGYRMDGPQVAAMRAPLMQAAASGDAGAAASLRKLDFAAAAAPAIAQARAMAPGELSAALDREEQQFQLAPPSEFQAARHKAMRAVADAAQKALGTFPTEILRGQGVAPVVALDPSASPSDPGFVSSLSERGRQADYAASTLPGAARKVFSPQEASGFKQRMGEASEGDKIAMLGTLRGALSPAAYKSAVDQLFGDDPAARVAGRLATYDPSLAQDVMRGVKLLDLPEIKDKGPELRDALRRVMPSDLWPNVETQDDAIRAAMAVYAADRGRQGLLYEAPDRKGLEAAMTRVAGEFSTRNGRKVAMPRGMPANVFNGALDGLTASDLAPFGGASWSVDPKPGRDAEPIDPQFLARNATLTQIGLGDPRYLVTIPLGGGREQAVRTATGRPLVIDMAELARRRNPAPPKPADLGQAIEAQQALGGGLQVAPVGETPRGRQPDVGGFDLGGVGLPLIRKPGAP